MKDYEEKVINIMDSAKDNIRTQLDKAYKSGYEDAKFELGKKVIDLTHEKNDRLYQQGLEDMWDIARKIIHDRDDEEGLDLRELVKIFGTNVFDRILKENTASEAITKIKEYEKKKKQDTIQVGDEVITEFGNKGIVITNILSSLGDISVWFPTSTHVQMYPVKDLSKTGRHFDAIAEVLAEIRGEE